MKLREDDQSIAYRDLAGRCRPVSFLYPLAALLTLAYGSGLSIKPTFSMFALTVFLGWASLRSTTARAVQSTQPTVPQALRSRLGWVLIGNGVLWGLFAALAVAENRSCEGWLALDISAIMVAGAISTMAPNYRLFLGFTGALLLPSAAVLLCNGVEDNAMIGWLVLGLGGLSVSVGRVQNRNYWNHLVEGRRKTEELTSARERLELVVAGSNLGAFDWRLDRREFFLDSKAADILQYPQELFNPYKGPREKFLYEDDLEAINSVLATHLGHPESPFCEIEVRVRSSTGDAHWFLFRGRVVHRTETGQPTRVSGTYEDITRRREAEAAVEELQQRVQQAERLKTLGVLAGGVAHDLNNSLTAFVGNLELAELELAEASPAKNYLKGARRSAMDASKLSDQLLAYAGKGRYVIQNMCLNGLLEDLTPLLRKTTVVNDIELRTELFPKLPLLDGDTTQIRQVVTGLVTNAVESMEGPGEITLRTSLVQGDPAEADYVCLEVLDHGCGMEAHVLEKIFDPFFTTKFVGRGLGLASALGIARSHKGDLVARSEPGKGSTVSLLLPVSETPDLEGTVAERPEDCPPIKILVVDDEEEIRSVTEAILTRAGHQVVLAEDGVAALKQLADHSDIALVVLDLSMPNKNGSETLMELRQSWPHLPVLLSSGYSESGTTPSVRAEAQGFLKKPFTREQLLRAVLESQTLPS